MWLFAISASLACRNVFSDSADGFVMKEVSDWLRSEPKLTPPAWWTDLERSDLPLDEGDVERFRQGHAHD